MGKGNFSDDFKRDAVRQITERGYRVAEVSQRLGVSQPSLYVGKKLLGKPPGASEAEQAAEVRRLKRELVRVTEERDNLKKAAAYFAKDAKWPEGPREGANYAFVAEHRPLFSVRAMCRCLRIHPSGFYAWLKAPMSERANEDARQTDLLRDAWKDSGKVYGYRKLHDDLVYQGETCCPNLVARLARLAGIRAEIGYKRRPGICGGRPSVVVDNTLDRQFDVETPDVAWVTDITYIKTLEGFASVVVALP
jgi:putative transposase